MSTVDPAFRVIPKNSTFFYIWRIEKLQVVPIPRDQYGTFYTGDSYIIASATEYGERADCQMKPREVKGKLDIHIHFWLGAYTSQDEAGVAAYKTVELDDYLGGTPVQHREVQGYESKRFLSYFQKGIRLLEGGIASGFSEVDLTVNPRLYHIKGKRRPLIRQLPEVSWESMNDGDVYVLETGQIIFVWTGKNANYMEKIQGACFAQQLKGQHSGSCVVIVEDGQEQAMSSAEREFFDQYLPLKDKTVKPSERGMDLMIEKKQRSEIKLYRCSDEGGTLKVTEMKNGPLDQKDLISQDSYIIDNGEAGIWLWVGKRASQKERTEAMRNAQGFIKKKGYPNYTQVTRVIDGGEPTEFKSLFRTWHDANSQIGLGKVASVGKIAKTVQTKFDASTLHENRKLAAQTQMVDDGTGTKEVFRVCNFDVVPLDEKDHGKFFSGDCYIVVYAYNNGQKDRFIIYYWLGRNSSVDEQGTAALKTIEMDEKLNGQAVQVRVVEGKEPPHFMAIFSGKMIIFQGGFRSGFQNAEDDSGDVDEVYLLQVRGTSEFNTKAVQVPCTASSLNSNDVFVLFLPKTVFIWAGKGSTGDEREMAKRLASQTGNEVVLVSEGQEKDDFWEAIGGPEPYANDKRLQAPEDSHMPRLFQCSNARGFFMAEEIVDFDQGDLVEDDVMLLDAWESLFLWFGVRSNKAEQRMSVEFAQEYLHTDPSGRDETIPVVIIKQGHEPPTFTGFFGSWDTELWSRSKSFEDIREEIMNENPTVLNVQTHANGQESFEDVEKFPLEVLLIKDPSQLPEGIDPTRKELHLTEEDFIEVMGMPYSEFQALSRWKQLDLKKKAGLF